MEHTANKTSFLNIGGLNLPLAESRIKRKEENVQAGDAANRSGPTVEKGEIGARVVTVEDRDGSRFFYFYDNSNRLAARRDARGNVTRYTYNADGKLEMVVHPDGSVLEYVYDEEGNLIQRIFPNKDTEALDYERGLLKSVRFAPDDTVRFDYSKKGTLQTITEPGCTTTLEYNSERRVTGITRLIDGAKYKAAYDDAGRIITLELPNGGKVIYDDTEYSTAIKYEKNDIVHDRDANILSIPDNTFKYDSREQLIEARSSKQGTIQYEYDSVGNRTTRKDSGSTKKYKYDKNNRLIRITTSNGLITYLAYDANGNLIQKKSGDDTWCFEYNRRQQLTCVRRNGEVQGRYRYDFMGRRFWRQTEDATTIYHHDLMGRPVAMTGAKGELIAAFVYQPGRTVARFFDSNFKERVLFLYTDHVNSTVKITDKDDNAVWKAEYSPFGRLLNPPPDMECPLFTGQFFDKESGLYYFGARYLDPEIGRFISPDPWTAGPDDTRLLNRTSRRECPPASWTSNPRLANRYLYCLNNPKTLWDPTGLSAGAAVGKTILAFLWSLPWSLLGIGFTIFDWVWQYVLFGWSYLDYDLDGVSSLRIGSAAMINIGGPLNFPMVLANIIFTRYGFVCDLDDITDNYIVPATANRNPRELRPARTAYFEKLLCHTVHANYSGPFWPFVYLFGSNALEQDAVRDSGFSRIAEPTLTVAPDKVHSRDDVHLIVVGGDDPYTGSISDAAAGTIESTTGAAGAFTPQDRFHEARYKPEYVPGDYTITVEDADGLKDECDVEIVELEVDEVEAVVPDNLVVDDISDDRTPTIRLIDQASATVEIDIEPDEGAVFFEAVEPDPIHAPDKALALTPTNGRGDTNVEITLRSAPTPVPSPGCDIPQDYTLRVKAWDVNGADIKFIRVRSMAQITVVLQIHIVREDNGTNPAFSTAKVNSMIDRANEIWAQAGVRFEARADIHFIDESDFKEINYKDPVHEDEVMFRWRATPPGPFPAPNNHNNQDTDVIHAYFIESFPTGAGRAAYVGAIPCNYIVLAKTSSPSTLAHELGHCLGLTHPKLESPEPRECSKRLMTTGASNRGEPYLIGNQAHPARPGNGADETRFARGEALNRRGP